MDKELGRYDKWDFCVDAVYVYNTGKYDADDEYNAANDGADKYDVDTNDAYDCNDEVFWLPEFISRREQGCYLPVCPWRRERTFN